MVEIKKLVPHKHADVIKAFADGKHAVKRYVVSINNVKGK